MAGITWQRRAVHFMVARKQSKHNRKGPVQAVPFKDMLP
jgi:hypothetical protein